MTADISLQRMLKHSDKCSRNKNMKILLSVLLIISVVIAMTSCSLKTKSVDYKNYTYEDNDDISEICSRMVNDLYDSEVDPSEYLAQLCNDGSFSDIDYYTDKKDTWHPAEHLDRILIMEKAAYSPENKYYKDKNLINFINKAIEFWVKKDFYCDWNDWWNNLGTGPKIADILLFPNDGLDKSNIDTLTEKLYSITCFTEEKKRIVKEREINSTGGNLTDTVNHSLKYAVLTDDGSAIMCLTHLIENELRPFPSAKLFEKRWDAEGIKADMSFQQHFEHLYFGGYGEVFLNGMNTYIKYTDGTQFALSDDKLNFYQDFILDGIQFAVRGNTADINASGRSIVRKKENTIEITGLKQAIINACYILLDCNADLTRKSELESLISSRNGDIDQGAGGHRYFFSSDYQVYNNKNYMASVRAASKRTKNSEALNGENVLGHYLGAGATMYYIDGEEYFNIFPLWNWNKIPGTTTAQGYLPYGGDNTYTRMGKASFVGGVSNGKIGMSCLDYNDNKVKAKKVWFMFDEGVVCLGTNISSNSKYDIFTCINQTLTKDDFAVSENSEVYTAETYDKTGSFDWVYNNKIGYITDSPVSVKVEERTGNWQTISERVDSEAYAGKVFEIGISHAVKPKKESYDYTVLMNTTVDRLNAYCQNPSIETLSNTDSVQAVYDKDSNTIMAVFWKKGTLSFPNGDLLTVSRGCALICEEQQDAYKIYISNPLQNGKDINVSINGIENRIAFEKGMYAGATKEIMINKQG